jgi:hypothetical protein
MRKVLSGSLAALVLLLSMGVGITGAFSFLGDINSDGKVNQLDLALLGQAWNSHEGDLNYNACADLNKDGVIDVIDLSILGQHWGEEKDYVETFVMSGISGEIIDPIFSQYASEIDAYHLVADQYTDGCKNYWEIWLRKTPSFPNCSSDIYVTTEITESYTCEIGEFLSSVDIKQLLIEATEALMQNIAGEFCSASCLYCSLMSEGVCGLICVPACFFVQYYPL